MGALVENRTIYQIVYHPKHQAINIFIKLKYNIFITANSTVKSRQMI
jgi:hypothetical protein